MKSESIVMTVAELKSRFSEALDAVREGRTVVVSFGRGRRKIAAMVPYSHYASPGKRTLGLLKNKASVKFSKDFSLGDEILLES
jgi:prevent-host-death family protein